jgi:hypothetical protein
MLFLRIALERDIAADQDGADWAKRFAPRSHILHHSGTVRPGRGALPPQ